MIYLLLYAQHEENYALMKNTTSLIIQTLSHYDALHTEFVLNGEVTGLPKNESFYHCSYTTKITFFDFVDAQCFHNGSNANDMGSELTRAFTAINNSQCSTDHQLLMLLTDVPVNDRTLELIKQLQATSPSNVDIFTFLFGDQSYDSFNLKNTKNLTHKNGGLSFLVDDALSMGKAVSSYYLPYTDQVYGDVTWTYNSNPLCFGDIVSACAPAYTDTSQLIGVVCVGIEQDLGVSVSGIENNSSIIVSFHSVSLAKQSSCICCDLK